MRSFAINKYSSLCRTVIAHHDAIYIYKRLNACWSPSRRTSAFSCQAILRSIYTYLTDFGGARGKWDKRAFRSFFFLERGHACVCVSAITIREVESIDGWPRAYTKLKFSRWKRNNYSTAILSNIYLNIARIPLHQRCNYIYEKKRATKLSDIK